MSFMLALFIYFLIKDDTSRWQVSLGGILVSALPLLLLKTKRNPFNVLMIYGYYLFILCTIFLGSIASFYLHFTWWDTTLHFYKGLFIGVVSIAIYKAFLPERMRRELSQWLLFLFVFSLPVVASAFWEIYEFTGDQFFTHTMQRGGNTDTMYDIIAGTAGGLIVAVYARIRYKKI